MFDSMIFVMRMVEIIALMYVILVAAYTFGWFRLRQQSIQVVKHQLPITIVVALRNEASNIHSLVKHLAAQNYPPDAMQILLIDDHSEDETYKLLTENIQQFPQINFHCIRAEKQGKKHALQQAFASAVGELILVTDADCKPHPLWASTMVSAFYQFGAKILLGPVLIEGNSNLFNQLQSLEWLSLMGSTAGAAAIGWPNMANGANMAFEKKAASQVQYLRNDSNVSSGDDVFLMQAITKHFGSKAVRFVAASSAIVSTKAVADLKSFFRQRIRWTSKSTHYRSLSIIIPALIVFIFNAIWVGMFVASIFFPWMMLVTMLFLGLKALIDFPLLLSVSQFMRQRSLMRYFLPLTFIYPFYVLAVALAGLFSTTTWKGRVVEK